MSTTKPDLYYNNPVFIEIVDKAKKEIDGILALKTGILTGKRSSSYNQKTELSPEEGDIVDVYLEMILEFGKSAPEIFTELKNLFYNEITGRLKLPVGDFRLTVRDVMTKEEYDKKEMINKTS